MSLLLHLFIFNVVFVFVVFIFILFYTTPYYISYCWYDTIVGRTVSIVCLLHISVEDRCGIEANLVAGLLYRGVSWHCLVENMQRRPRKRCQRIAAYVVPNGMYLCALLEFSLMCRIFIVLSLRRPHAGFCKGVKGHSQAEISLDSPSL